MQGAGFPHIAWFFTAAVADTAADRLGNLFVHLSVRLIGVVHLSGLALLDTCSLEYYVFESQLRFILASLQRLKETNT